MEQESHVTEDKFEILNNIERCLADDDLGGARDYFGKLMSDSNYAICKEAKRLIDKYVEDHPESL